MRKFHTAEHTGQGYCKWASSCPFTDHAEGPNQGSPAPKTRLRSKLTGTQSAMPNEHAQAPRSPLPLPSAPSALCHHFVPGDTAPLVSLQGAAWEAWVPRHPSPLLCAAGVSPPDVTGVSGTHGARELAGTREDCAQRRNPGAGAQHGPGSKGLCREQAGLLPRDGERPGQELPTAKGSQQWGPELAQGSQSARPTSATKPQVMQGRCFLSGLESPDL